MSLQTESRLKDNTQAFKKYLFVCLFTFNLLGLYISRIWKHDDYPRLCEESKQKDVKMEILEAQSGQR